MLYEKRQMKKITLKWILQLKNRNYNVKMVIEHRLADNRIQKDSLLGIEMIKGFGFDNHRTYFGT